MAYSTNTFTYAGGAQTFELSLSLGYLSESDITVFVVGELDGGDNQIFRAFTFDSEFIIRVTDALTVNDEVTVERTVSKGVPIVDFETGGDVTARNLMLLYKQVFMAQQELLDGRIDGANIGTLKAELDAAILLAADQLTDAEIAAVAAAASEAAAAISETNAAASAAAALVSEGLADADAIATAADRVQTGLDVIETAGAQTSASEAAASAAAALVSEGLADADATATAADKIATNADAVSTGADATATGDDATATGADAVNTAADRVQTGIDSVDTNADKLAAAASAAAALVSEGLAEADKVQTGLDAAATAADRVQTGLDITAIGTAVTDSAASASAAATSETNAGSSATAAAGSASGASTSAGTATTQATNAGNSASASASSAAAALVSEGLADADAIATDADAIATAADRVQTGLDLASIGDSETNAAASAVAASGFADDAEASAQSIDVSEFVKKDGSTAFTAPQTGVAPTVDLHLATKLYVDDAAGGGGDFLRDGTLAMTGSLNLQPGAPTEASEAPRKDYVDGIVLTAQTQADLGVTNAATADGKAVTADGKAVAAQGTADTALANASTADGKAVAAQGTADTAITNAATADAKAVTADGKAVAAQSTADGKTDTTYVDNADALKANKANAALTGVPTAPTAAVDTDSTQLATCEFVLGQGGGGGGGPWEFVAEMYDFATDGNISEVETPDFEDGFAYRIDFIDLSGDGGGELLRFDLYKETDAVYAGEYRDSGETFIGSNLIQARIFLMDVRESITMHYGHGGARAGNLDIKGVWVGGMTMTAQKILKAKVRISGGVQLDGGIINLFRKAV